MEYIYHSPFFCPNCYGEGKSEDLGDYLVLSTPTILISTQSLTQVEIIIFPSAKVVMDSFQYILHGKKYATSMKLNTLWKIWE